MQIGRGSWWIDCPIRKAPLWKFFPIGWQTGTEAGRTRRSVQFSVPVDAEGGAILKPLLNDS
jgi:hypothetical protein